MKRLLWFALLLVLMTCAQHAKAQPPAAGAVRSGQTQVQNATNGNCLYNNAGVLGNKTCGGGGALPAGSAGCVQLYGTSTTFANGCAAQPGALIGNPAIVTGSELVTNGGFSGGTTGWALAGGAAYGTNNVVCTVVASGCSVAQATIATVSGNYYRVQFVVSAANAGMSFFFNNQNAAAANGNAPFWNGTWNIVFKADFTGTDTITFHDWSNVSGDTWTLTGVSIKQVSAATSPLSLTGPEGLSDFGIDGNGLNSGTGTGALQNCSGSGCFNNTADGGFALNECTSCGNNTAVGEAALTSCTTCSSNTAIGQQALVACTTCSENMAIGSQVFQNCTTCLQNAAVGFDAIQNCTTCTGNSGIGGLDVLDNCTTCTNNTAIGTQALANCINCSGNVAIGFHAGFYESGSNAFYVDNRDRTDTAGEKAGAILYGTFNATAASQTLTANAVFKALGYQSSDGTAGTTGGNFKNGLCITAAGACSNAGTVTSVGETFTGGLISVGGSPITTSGTFALTVAGTSGGIPYFSGAATWASSGAGVQNAMMAWGGAGNAPTSPLSLLVTNQNSATETWTLYNSTASTGKTSFIMREGPGLANGDVLWGMQNNSATRNIYIQRLSGADYMMVDSAAGANGAVFGSSISSTTTVPQGGLNIVSSAANVLQFGTANGMSWNSDTSAGRDAAGIFGITNGTLGTTAANYRAIAASAHYAKGTTFTASGCSNGTLSGGSTAGKMTLGAASCTVVVTMGNSATAPNGWSCAVEDQTTVTALVSQSASTTTTASFSVPVTAGGADVLVFHCIGY